MAKEAKQKFARDENEVALCIKDLNMPSFYPSMVSIWVTDSFERKDMERDLLMKLLINLTKSQEGMISRDQPVKGFEAVVDVLEDAVNDAPKAAEFLGRILARVMSEKVIPLAKVGQLIYEGGEKQGRLVELALAAEVLGSILDIIKSEKGDSVLDQICSSSKLQLEIRYLELRLCILEINRSRSDRLNAQIALEQLQERDQMLIAHNDMLKNPSAYQELRADKQHNLQWSRRYGGLEYTQDEIDVVRNEWAKFIVSTYV
ncbi:hypothetical protein OROHE_005693 [Orobanche hederae]